MTLMQTKSELMTVANKRSKFLGQSESLKSQYESQKPVFVNGGVGFYDTKLNQSLRKGIQEGNVSEGEIEADIDDLDFGMM